jgi:tellurite resistance protein
MPLMTTNDELSPLFTDVAMSTDDATAIVAALKDIAESDGMHDDELRMIEGFVLMLNADFDVEETLAPMTPELLASKLTDPTLRTVALQCAVLLAWADGKFSDKERERITDYANALDVPGPEYEKIERVITAWVKAGDFGPLMS